MDQASKIQGVAFDLEGTVIDVEEAHHKGHLAAAAEAGVDLTLETALEKLPHFIGGPDDVIIEEIWQLSDQKKSVSFIAERDRFYYQKLLAELPIVPRPGFLELLEKIRKQGIKTSIGSLTAEADALLLLERSGLTKQFSREITILREDVAALKPAPDVFLATARCMQIDPRSQLVFEDSPRGVKAALAAGSAAVGMPVYDRPEVIAELEKAGATKVFLSWKDVLENYDLLFNQSI